MLKQPARLTDKSDIRHRLNKDREWSLYALADLDDGMYEHTEWWGCGESIALVFRALTIRPIFLLADEDGCRELLQVLPEPRGYLNIKPELLDAAAGVYEYRERHEMIRMFLDESVHHEDSAELLGPADREDIEELFATGNGGGTGFAAFQLQTGLFRGIRKNGELLAAGGVHIVSESESVAGVGNIFTRPDARGRGLAQKVTSSIVAALRHAGIRTIGLNVEHTNTPAIRAYERVGFRSRFRYYEGVAERCAF